MRPMNGMENDTNNGLLGLEPILHLDRHGSNKGWTKQTLMTLFID